MEKFVYFLNPLHKKQSEEKNVGLIEKPLTIEKPLIILDRKH